MKWAIWLTLFAVFACLALLNPGGTLNGGTFAVILLGAVLIYCLPELRLPEEEEE